MAAQKTRVRITNTATSVQTITDQNGEITAFEVTGLDPLTTYTAEAALMYNDTWQPFTSPYTFTTLPLSQSSYLTSYDSDREVYTLNNPSNAYTEPTSASGYASIYLVRGAGAVTYIYWHFGNMNIPQGATVLSITFKFRVMCETTVSARIPVHTAQLYVGTTTAKGTTTTIANTATTYTVTFNPNSWTVDELNNATLKIYAERGTENANTAYGFRLYGAEMVVEYSV